MKSMLKFGTSRYVAQAILWIMLSAFSFAAYAHNLQTKMVYMFFDPNTQACLDARIDGTALPAGCQAYPGWAPGQPLLKVDDELGLVIKVVPRDGTTTGVGGHVDFYVPNGVEVTDVGYLLPGDSNPTDGISGFDKVPMKGQSLIATGAGPIGAKITSELIGLVGPYTNINGVTQSPVNASGLHLGTIAGVYGDTGVFYSTDPDTAYGSWQRFTGDAGPNDVPLCGTVGLTTLTAGKTITNNSGDVFIPCNKWDAEQMFAWGAKGTTYANASLRSGVAIVDYPDQRGNMPWGFASGVAGPESGYKWNFDWDAYITAGGSATSAANVQAGMSPSKVGPWKRLKYAGSRVSFDQPGSLSTALGLASKDAGSLGVLANTLPITTSQTDTTSPKAIRWAVGQLTNLIPEYVWVKVKVKDTASILNADGCPRFHADTFGGDAGGTDGGKDHLWRYYEPSRTTVNGCVMPGKPTDLAAVKAGQTYQYKVKAYNLGNKPLTNVVVKDTLPSGVVFVSAFPAQNSGPNPLVWNLGTQLPGEKFEAIVTVRATGSGAIDNTMCVTSTEYPNPECTSETVSNVPVLRQTKTASALSAAPGSSIDYTIRIDNIGTAPSTGATQIAESLETGLTCANLVSATLNGASITPTVSGCGVPGTNNPTFTFPTGINAGSSLVLTFTANISPSAAPGTYCNNYSTFSGGVPITTGSLACFTLAGGKIGDTIWRDWNGNGVQDTGEQGISGVVVKLYDSTNTLKATTTTDSNGNYYFNGVQAGTYVVKVNDGNPLAGYTQTGDPDQPGVTCTTCDGTDSAIVLAADQQYLTSDFGYKPTGAGNIGDKVFEDISNDGVFNGSDAGIPNVTVWLYVDSNNNGVIDAGDPLVATTASNASGDYTFANLATGINYLVKVDKTDPDIQTYFNTKYDPDPVPYQLSTAESTSSPNLTGSDLDNDFGFWRVSPASIGDQIFVDSNNNGVYDSGDVPLSGITVKLYLDLNSNGVVDPGETFTSTSSAANGTYSFNNLGPVSYIVVVDTTDPDLPGGYFPKVTQYSQTLTAGQNVVTADFPFLTALTKTVDKTYAVAGNTLNYTIVPRYPSDALLSGASVSDPIPAGTTYVTASANDGGQAIDETDPPDGVIESVVWDLGGNSLGASGFVGGTAPAACSTTMTVVADRDTWIDGAVAAQNHGTDTIDTANDTTDKVGLLHFNIGPSTLPVGSTISDIELRLAPDSGQGNNRQIELHQLTNALDWAEGTAANAVCTSSGNGAAWQGPNCTDDWTAGNFSASDYSGTNIATLNPTTADTAIPVNNAAIDTVVNGWLGGGTNRGLAMIPVGSANNTVSWHSRTSATTALRPQIVITYTPNGCSGVTTIRDTGANEVPDSYIQQDSGGNDNFGTNASLKNRPESTKLKHSLIKFNMASVPAGVTITSAVMSVNVTTSKTNQVHEVHRMLTAWVEGTDAKNGVQWNDPNGTDTAGVWASGAFSASDYSATSLGNIVPGSTGVKTLSITSQALNWYNGTDTNNGLVLLSTGTSTADSAYASSENGTVVNRPTLSVSWSISPSGTTGSNTLSASSTLVQNGDPVTVKMVLTNTTGAARTNMAPSALSITGQNGAGATCGSPSSSSVTVPANGSATITWFCTASVPANTVGSVTFSASATNGTSTYSSATSNSVIVAVPLTFQVTVNNPLTVPLVDNLAQFSDGATVITANAQTATTASISNFVWSDTDGNGSQDSGEPGIAGVRVYIDANSNGMYDSGESNDITDANGIYSISDLNAGTYAVRIDPATYPSGYVPTTAGLLSVPLTTGQQYVDADFGLQPAPLPGSVFDGSIGDTVWLDADNDGLQDPGEQLLSGITVKLYRDLNNNGVIDPTDPLVGADITDANGLYGFSGLPIGPTSGSPVNYLVQVDTTSSVLNPYTLTNTTLAASMSTTTGTPVNSIRSVPLYSGSANVTNADFGYRWGGSIGDFVWYDTNANGLQDETNCSGLPCGAPNTTLVLWFDANNNGQYDPGEPSVGTYVTTNTGAYLFDNLPPGSYVVQSSEQEIPSPTTGKVNVMVPTTNGSPAVALAPNQDITTVDFGYAERARIEGHVFHDGNSNGILESGEGLQSNITVTLTGTDLNGNPVTMTTTTNASGEYVFQVPAGNYTITYTPGTFGTTYPTATTPNTINLSVISGTEYNNNDFGRNSSGSLGDRVWNDADNDGVQDAGELGIAGVTVQLYASNGTSLLATTATDANGLYNFPGLADGTYVVKVLTSTLTVGFTQTYDNSGVTTDSTGQGVISGGNTVNTVDFGYRNATSYAVNGNVWNDNGNGGGTAGNGIKDGTEPGIGGTTVTLYKDANNNNLYDAGEEVFATTTTDASGNYSFPGVPNGDYVVVVDKNTLPSTAFVQTGDPDGTMNSQSDVTVSGANPPAENFGYKMDLGSITGSVCTGNGNGDCNKSGDPSESGQAGITVILTYAGSDGIMGTADDVVTTALTDNNGDYSFSGQAPGLYQITKINPAGMSSLADIDGGNPNFISLILSSGQGQTNQDFEIQPAAGSIGDSVWLDVDRDGVQDIGEPGLSNVSVALWSAGADGVIGNTDDRLVSVTNSDLQGNYLFSDVPAGKYYVKVDKTTLPTTGLSETAGNVNSQTSLITLAGGETYLTADFGYVGAASKAVIGNFIWSDANHDGVQDPGEPGIGGVTVALKTTGGATIATVTTDADGSYYFTGVNPGQYVVDVTDTAGKLTGYTITVVGPQSSTDPTAPITVIAGQTYDKADFGYYNAGLHSVADRVWFDADRDGIQDPGEAGIAGVTVNLYADLDGDGSYTKPVIDGNVDSNHDGFITAADNCTGCFLGYDIVNGLIYSGVSPLTGVTLNGVAVINGQLDVNGDGSITAADDGRAVNEPVIATALTNDVGDFAFTGLPDGNYVIEIADNSGQLTGYQGTTPDAQAYLRPVTVAGADVTGVHFGYASLGPIGDTVFSDANGNGIQDPGESGIPGVTVVLYRDADNNNVFDPAIDLSVATQVTDGAGKYFFDNLVAGTYFASVDNGQTALSGYTKTTTDQETGNQPGKVSTEINATLAAGVQNRNVIDGSLDLNADGAITSTDDGFANGVQVIDGKLDLNGDGIVNTSDDGWWNGIQVIDGQLDVVAGGGITAADDGTVSIVQPVFLNADFGYQNTALANISGTVWNDPNKNAVLENGEPRLGGVTVNLVDSTGKVLATATTDASGNYTFPDVKAGDYKVVVTDNAGVLSGYTLTSGLDQIPVTVSGTTSVANVNFGYVNQSSTTGSIGDTVWLDANNDGVFGANETGLSGVTVELKDALGNAIDSDPNTAGVQPTRTVTDASGHYQFGGLSAGNFTVDVISGVPANLTTSNGTTDPTGVINLSGGQTYLNADFGYKPASGYAVLGDTVWYDVNGNGLQDPNEVGIGGVTVKVINSATQQVVALVTTAPDGTWQATIPEDGTPTQYVIIVDTATLPGGLITTPTNLNGGDTYLATVKDGDVRLNLDFGYKGGVAGVIGDQVFLDANGNNAWDAGEGLSGVTLGLYSIGIIDGKVDVNGNGAIDISDDGSYGGYAVVDGVLQSVPANTTINGMKVISGQLDANHDGVIGTNDDLAPAQLASAITDANGLYLFDGLLPGDYRVKVTGGLPSGLSQTVGAAVPTSVITLSSVNSYSVLTADFGYVPASGTAVIGDRVWSDTNNDGLQNAGEVGIGGVTVRLCTDSTCTTTVATTTTDPDGSYQFTNVVPGTYTVVVTAPGGYSPTYDLDGTGTANNATLTVTANTSNLIVDFGYRNTTGANGSIGDTVYNDANGNKNQDSGETGINGVTLNLVSIGVINGYVDLNGDSVITTADDGSYGGFTVTDGVIAASDGTVINGITVKGGRLDVNGDNIITDRDFLNPLVIATTTTATAGPNAGVYSFTGLSAGDYRVVVSDTANVLTGQSPTQVSGGAISIACTSGCTNVTTADFGYTASTTGTGKIGDTVYFDTNGNGVQNPGEVGIGGVTLNLVSAGTDGNFGTADDKVVGTTTTDPNGLYNFDGLPSGKYKAVVTDTNKVLGGLTATQTAGEVVISCGPACNTDDASDFGYKSTTGGTGTLGGTLWHDTNTSTETGVLNTGEPRLAGVTVELWLDVNNNGAIQPGTDNLVRTTTTNSNGDYLFLGLPPGNYIVKVTDTNGVLAGMTSVTGPAPNADNNGHVDPYATNLTLGEVDTSVDFGYKANGASGTPVSLSGVVFEDAGTSLGVYNDPATGGSDAYVPGAAVYLYRVANGAQYLIGTTTTGANGSYSFTDLPAGVTYVVKVDTTGTLADGFEQTVDPDQAGKCTVCDSQYQVTLNANVTGINFGYWNGGVVTTPVSLSGFLAQKGETDGEVRFTWTTATEAGNVAFNLYVDDSGEWIKLNDEPILSKVVNSVEPQVYGYTAYGVNGRKFAIEDIDMYGKATLHEPYMLGKTYGVINSVADPINWKAIGEEHGKMKKKQNLQNREKMKGKVKKLEGEVPALRSEITSRALAVQQDSKRPGWGVQLAGWLVSLLISPAQAAEPPAPVMNFEVQAEGIYRVTYEQLLNEGLDLSKINPKTFAVSNQGRPVPIYLSLSKGGTFAAGAYLEFIGHPIESLYTMNNVYTLRIDPAGGAWSYDDTTNVPKGSSVSYFMRTAHVEPKTVYSFANPGNDPWYVQDIREGQEKEYAINLDGYLVNPDPASDADKVSYKVDLWGGTDFPGDLPDHHVQVKIDTINDLLVDDKFNGVVAKSYSGTVTSGLASGASHYFTIKLPGDTGYDYDLIGVDSLEMTYPSNFQSSDGASFKFSHAGSKYQVTGLINSNAGIKNQVMGLFNNSNVVVYRVSNNTLARLSKVQVVACITTNCTFSATFAGNNQLSEYYVATNAGVMTPTFTVPAADTSTLLKGEADLLVITHPDFSATLNSSRAKLDLDEYSSIKIVDTEAIYAAYGNHIIDPLAIKKYIAYAYKNLKTRHVLLVGGDTSDPNNYRKLGATSFVPTLYAATGDLIRWAPVDPLFTDVDDDGIPDLAIGRYPVRTNSELLQLFTKQDDYSKKIELGYDKTAIFAADAYDKNQKYDFKGDAEKIIEDYFGDWSVNKIYIDDLGAKTAHSNLLAAINSGKALTAFIGHSAPNLWTFNSPYLLQASELLKLTNAGKPTVLVQLGCWNTYFVSPYASTMAHNALLAGNRGAVAVLGSTTLTAAEAERDLAAELFARLKPGISMGDALLQAKRAYAKSNPQQNDVILGWTLLGHPGLPL